jgi:hypothetical protein
LEERNQFSVNTCSMYLLQGCWRVAPGFPVVRSCAFLCVFVHVLIVFV